MSVSNDVIAQVCPLCQQENMMTIEGTRREKTGEGAFLICNYKGYSHCSCRNIYYTDWSNIEPEVYDSAYVKQYEGIHTLYKNYTDLYLPVIREHVKEGLFFEIGCINDTILDEARDAGYATMGLDMIPRETGHPMVTGDFEFVPEEEIKPVDILWASHIFEHFERPLKAIDKCNRLLAMGGVMFVSMPDLHFLDKSDPHGWGHWHINEHHILWERDSFIEEMEKHGFKCLYKVRNYKGQFVCIHDFHTIFQKVSEV